MRRFYEGTLGLRFVSEGRAPEHMARAFRLSRGSATVVRLQTSNGERTGDQRVESRPGLYVASLRDPEGNFVELVQYDDIATFWQYLS